MLDLLTVRRIIKAPPERVFAAWTDPVLLVQWWGPGPVTCPEAEVDLREGGAYRLANREIDGSITWIHGAFEVVRPPEELVYSWSVSGLVHGPTRVRVRFLAHPEGTELIVDHDGFASGSTREMHGEGWHACLDKLEAMLR